MTWLRDPALPDDAFAGVKYTVFGCGDTDWAATYQAVPTLLDTGTGTPRRPAGCIRAEPVTRTPISTTSTGRGTRRCGPTWPPRWTCRPPPPTR